MTDTTAINLAIEAMTAQIETLAIDANLVDIWSRPQPTELITCDYRTPRTVAASRKRAQLRDAIAALTRMRPVQRTLDIEL